MTLILPPMRKNAKTTNSVNVCVFCAPGRACLVGGMINIEDDVIDLTDSIQRESCCPCADDAEGLNYSQVTVYKNVPNLFGDETTVGNVSIPDCSSDFAAPGHNLPFADGVLAEHWLVPPRESYVFVCYGNGVKIDPGEDVEAVPWKGNPADHYICKRPENRQVTFNGMYVTNGAGISRLRNCISSLWVETRIGCGSYIASEVILVNDVLLQNLPLMDSTNDNQKVELSVTGPYSNHMVFNPAND